MQHPDETAILRYVSDRVSEDEQLAVDAHMAECPACQERVHTLLHVRDNFGSLWQTWTAEEHGQAFRQWQLVEALSRVSEGTPSLAARARCWLERLGDAVEVAVEALLDRARRVALAGASELPSGYQFQLRTAHAGVGAAEELAHAEAHLRHGGELLLQGEAESAVQEALRAAAIDARTPQAATGEVRRHGGNLVMEIVVNSRRQSVSVKYWPSEGEGAPALALLLPRSAEAPPVAAEFMPVPDASYLLADFEQAPSGPFTIRIGPLVGNPRQVGADARNTDRPTT